MAPAAAIVAGTGGRAGVLAAVLARPWLFALLVAAAYLLLVWPKLAAHQYDPSIFIVAGDRYVEAGHTAGPIDIRPGSDGYDGQFYYRLAVDPLDFSSTAHGITFDVPPWRMQRIFYPLLARAAALGDPARIPAALFAVNLFGIGAIAFLAAALVRQAALSPLTPLAIVLWPGLLTGLTHDTTEIAAAAIMLAALLCYAHRRFLPYAVLAGLATLTRETTLLVFAGLLLHDAHLAWTRRRLSPALVAGVLLLVPFVAWREILTFAWHSSPQTAALGTDLGLPLAGVVRMLADCLTGARAWASLPLPDLLTRTIVLLTALPLLGFCVLVAIRLRTARGPLAPLAFSWALIALLMSLLVASWIDPTGYLRAFTECYVIGCLVLASTHPAIRSATLRRAIATIAVTALGASWFYILAMT